MGRRFSLDTTVEFGRTVEFVATVEFGHNS